jgi:hypothetical protein
MSLDNGLSMEQRNQIGGEVVTACRIGHFNARIPGTSRFAISPRRSM